MQTACNKEEYAMYLIVLAGMPASGKSTVAKKLREAFHLPVLERTP